MVVDELAARMTRGSDRTATVLGIECGGTRTVALFVGADGLELQRAEAGPANLRLLTDEQLAGHFQVIASELPSPGRLGIGMAGAREESDRRQIRAAAATAWPGVPCWAGNDLDTALAAADLESARPATGQAAEARPGSAPEGTTPPLPTPAAVTRVIIIAGTGSCCFGRNPAGQPIKVGGWGHLLGDGGSGYDIGLRSLRNIIACHDETGCWPSLGARLLTALALNEPNDLVTWLLAAKKPEVAALAKPVFAAAAARDSLAIRTVDTAARALAHDAITCARRLGAKGNAVEFVFTGGVLTNQADYARRVVRGLRRSFPRAATRVLGVEGAWGAVALAQGLPVAADVGLPDRRVKRASRNARAAEPFIPKATAPSPTEARNPRSTELDRQTVESAIELMLTEDARLPAVLLQHRDQLAEVVRMVTRAFQRGGRLFYVGAGTSGRLGVLDASECPPTFRSQPELVQGIMAGGPSALWSSVEGAEDDWEAGARAIEARDLRARDVVIGIAASGRTPFVWGALKAARRLRAGTVLLCFNPHLEIPERERPRVVIAPNVGPEVLTGSTRLKAGTATKLVLNIVTTLAMVQLGKVVSNLMVDLNPSNAKLRDRATRMVTLLTGTTPPVAQAALERSGWVVKDALRQLGCDPRHSGRALVSDAG